MRDEDASAPVLARRLARVAGEGSWTLLKNTRVTVVRAGDVVVKAHPPETDETALAARLRLAAGLPGVLLPPASAEVGHVDGRPVTVWPAGEPVDPRDPGAAPWEPAAELLARLHAAPVDGLALPPAGGPARVVRAVALLDGLDAAYAAPVAVIREAFGTLPREVRTAREGTVARTERMDAGTAREGAAPPVTVPSPRSPDGGGPPRAWLTHGDWHLGQIIRYQGEWLLIDVDDLGAGVAAWDLARPAAWYATGLLDPAAWERFLGAYLAAGGSAVPTGDPWRELDVPARALTVQLAATAVAAAGTEGRPLDEVERALVSSCGRITRTAAAQ
ncbi:aminoglycoside phosphotransferase family protein [Sphaerisporangium album]|uniref:Aminoglycoside phosphotransferase family protein n=1 Tax=Sphaerisporangium album TaxID=509200 RepID=A0A367FSU5_9ACTN|nr:aminoglycoside phosphotransferase family protein [Sphaerisporangium album]